MQKTVQIFVLTVLLCFSDSIYAAQCRNFDERIHLKCKTNSYPAIERKELFIPSPLSVSEIKSISSFNTILSMTFNRNNVLTIGTEAGLLSLDPSTGEICVLNSRNGLPFNRITSLLSNDKDLWIGSSPFMLTRPEYGGLIRKTEGAKNITVYGRKQGLECNWIQSMLLDGSLLYIGTANGISFMDISSGKFIYNRDEINVKHMFISNDYLYAEGEKSLPESSELLQYNLETKVMTPFKTKEIFGFDRLLSTTSKNKQIWLTGYNFNNSKTPVEEFGGLNIFDTLSKTYKSVVFDAPIYKEWLKVKNIEGTLWILSDLGFGFIDNQDSTVIFYVAGSNNSGLIPEIMTKSAKGDIWLANSSHLIKYSDEKLIICTFTNTLSDNYITSLITGYGTLWAGTERGFVNRIDGNGNVKATYRIPCKTVNELFRDTHDSIYAFCSDNLIYTYFSEEDQWKKTDSFSGEKIYDYQAIPLKFRSLPEEMKLESYNKSSLFLEDKNFYWLSTYGSGLLQIKKNNKANRQK